MLSFKSRSRWSVDLQNCRRSVPGFGTRKLCSNDVIRSSSYHFTTHTISFSAKQRTPFILRNRNEARYITARASYQLSPFAFALHGRSAQLPHLPPGVAIAGASAASRFQQQPTVNIRGRQLRRASAASRFQHSPPECVETHSIVLQSPMGTGAAPAFGGRSR